MPMKNFRVKNLGVKKLVSRIRGRPRMNRLAVLIAGVSGAVVAFFADPARGRLRRNQLVDQVGARLLRVGRMRSRIVANTSGMWQKVTHLQPVSPAVDDVTLANRVETQIFRESRVDKGRVNVNVENGIVVLRGELSHPDEINALEKAARKVPGVVSVRNLLHLEGTPTRN